MTALPAYSVVIPAYNATGFVTEAIASIMAQTHKPDRIVVVDDGSDDDLAGCLSALDGPIKLLRQENAGAAMATNTGMEAVETDYVAGLDADDLWLPTKAEVQLRALAQLDQPACVFCRMQSFQSDPAAGAIEVDDSLSGWGRSTFFAPMDVWRAIGPMQKFPGDRGEMADWIARARQSGVTCHMMEDYLARRRLRPGSLAQGRDASLDRGYLQMMHEAIKRKRAAAARDADG